MGTKQAAQKILKGMRVTAEVAEGWINLVNTKPSKPLTGWEISFMKRITAQFKQIRFLEEHELDKLEEIYANKTD